MPSESSMPWLLPHERWIVAWMDGRRARGLTNAKFDGDMGADGADLLAVAALSTPIAGVLFFACLIATLATGTNLLGWAMIPVLVICGLSFVRLRQSKAATKMLQLTLNPSAPSSAATMLRQPSSIATSGSTCVPVRRDKWITWALLAAGI